MGNIVNVTIQNRSQYTISFADHRTNCTVLTIEQQYNGYWEAAFPCTLMIVTRMHTLDAGQNLEVKIVTSSAWRAGRYRAKLDYSLGKEPATRPSPLPAYSSEFQLN